MQRMEADFNFDRESVSTTEWVESDCQKKRRVRGIVDPPSFTFYAISNVAVPEIV
jgi:hypothetical protein